MPTSGLRGFVVVASIFADLLARGLSAFPLALRPLAESTIVDGGDYFPFVHVTLPVGAQRFYPSAHFKSMHGTQTDRPAFPATKTGLNALNVPLRDLR